ncbi:MAG: anaerobic ribonucleoside-triphosphate reductase [Candidatus Hydrogenedentes bacterium]|nr:anaerobic ribonucleoside-triphosphate reductase [Candidatus Hydrogenedentota bacterium]
MNHPDDASYFDSVPREGAYDAQLSFAVPFVAAPAPIAWIVKRDGREVPFEQRKIADAIFKAANTIGGEDHDRAASLASGVVIYLAKHLDGATPTVDQVHDAVERVLLEMGHARTARAYMRYRDRRFRARSLRAGDVSAILSKLDDAQRQAETLEATIHEPLFVRTSDERLAGWDRERIVLALVREARVPEDRARTVARAVEEQIARAGLTTLTAALVRELVDAKLVEHGLEKYRSRHMRLGVPLYDTEQIICTPNQGETESIQDPAATDIALAQRVKREFAMSSVHSADVTDAHLRGDIHIHDLTHVDRFRSAAHSLLFLKQFGLAVYSGKRYAPPPVTIEALLAQTVRFTSALQGHFVGPIRWTAFARTMGSLVDGDNKKDIERLARITIFGLMTPTGAQPVDIELPWDIADDNARAFTLAFAKIWSTVVDGGANYGVPRITVPVSREAMRDSKFRALLGRVLQTHTLRAHAAIRFERDATEYGPDWPARDIVGGAVTINLPRAAAQLLGEQHLFDTCGALVRAAVIALAERKAFLDRLYAFGGVGPMAALTFRHDGRAYVDPDAAQFVVAITGLNECAQAITGEELHRSRATVEFAQRLLKHLRTETETCGASERVNVVLGADDDGACARRFAMLDLHTISTPARAFIKNDSITRDATYTPGVASIGNLSPVDQLRVEGALHAGLSAPATSYIALGDADPSPESLVNLLEKALLQTNCASMRFV